MKKRQSQVCAYCGNLATTDDHIPPQSLLPGVPKRKRPNVPSCEACNSGASDDDEYVRDVIAMHHSIFEVPAASETLDSFNRAINNPKKRRYLRNIQSRISDVDTSSFGGILLGQQSGYTVDVARFQRTYARYIKGLHWLEFGSLASKSPQVQVLLDPERLRQIAETVKLDMTGGILRMIAPNVFFYKYKQVGDECSTTYWLACHFSNFPVLARTRILV
jgi:hypothetical protein